MFTCDDTAPVFPRCIFAAAGKWHSLAECEASCRSDTHSYADIAKIIRLDSARYKYPLSKQAWDFLWLQLDKSERGGREISAEVGKSFQRSRRVGARYLVKHKINQTAMLPEYFETLGVHQPPNIIIAFVQISKKNLNYADTLLKRLQSQDIRAEGASWLHDKSAAASKARLIESEYARLKTETERVRSGAAEIIYYPAKNLFDVGAIPNHKYYTWQFSTKVVYDYFSESVHISADHPTVIKVSLSFIGGDTELIDTHANSVIITGSAQARQAYIFEPHIYDEEISAHVEQIIGTILRPMLTRHKIKLNGQWGQTCPKGLQTTETRGYGSCQTWNALMAAMALINPTIPLSELSRVMIRLGHHATFILDLFVWDRFVELESGKYGGITDADREMVDTNIYDYTRAQYMRNRFANEKQQELINSLVPLRTWFWLDDELSANLRGFLREVTNEDNVNVNRLITKYVFPHNISDAIWLGGVITTQPLLRGIYAQSLMITSPEDVPPI